MTCKLYEDRLDELEDFLSGRLDHAQAEATQQHVVECAACRETLELSATGARLLRAGVQPAPAASAPFWTRMGALLRAEETKRQARADFFGSLEWLAWRTVSAAVMMVVILTGILILRPPSPRDTEQPTVSVFQEPEHPQNDDEVLMTLSARRNGR